MKRILFPFLLLLLSIGCNQLSAEDRARIDDLRERGETLAGTAIAVAPTYAATARAQAATAIAVAPTTVVNAQSAAATAAVNARAIATQAAGQGISLLGAVDQVQGFLGQVRPDENGNIQFALTEAQVTAALRLQESEAGEDARFENLNVSFGDGVMIVTGDVTRPIRAPFAVAFFPSVDELGAIQLTVTSATVGQISLPESVVQLAANRLSGTINRALGFVPGSYQFTSLQVNGQLLTVTAKRMP